MSSSEAWGQNGLGEAASHCRYPSGWKSVRLGGRESRRYDEMELLADYLTCFSSVLMGCVTPGQARTPLSLSSLMGNTH